MFPLDPTKGGRRDDPFFASIAIAEWIGPRQPPQGSASVLFDFGIPLEAQFHRAERYLRTLQEAYLKAGNLTLSRPRNHKEKWRDYLRVLDAKVASIPTVSIAQTLFPKINNEYPDYAGSKSVNNYCRAALRLRDRGYKGILLMPE
jgi:hypothetical protein